MMNMGNAQTPPVPKTDYADYLEFWVWMQTRLAREADRPTALRKMSDSFEANP